MMVDAAEDALTDTGARGLRATLQAVHVIRGIWPYRDPGRLVAGRLGLDDVRTGLTQLGGNGVYDLLNDLGADIAAGSLDAALVCSAETMRTRRHDKASGRRSPYLNEPETALPDVSFGTDRHLADAADFHAGAHEPVQFYAMAEVANRHRRGETPSAHLERIAALWARASSVAADNPNAWILDQRTAEEIATVGPGNRLVAAPYTKLMTSNIDVDQAAAVVMCSAATAARAGVPADRMVALRCGTGAHDHWVTRTRWALDRSPALREAGTLAIELAQLELDDIELLDLYSCFPSAVQVAQDELGIDPSRSFTITGGLTFAGGPYNSYCMHALARGVELIRDGAASALLSGNGGFFTKHSFTVLGAEPSRSGFRCGRPQAVVDALPARPEATTCPTGGTVEAYTVRFGKDGNPERAIVSVLAQDGSRTWANTMNTETMHELVATDSCGQIVDLSPPDPKTAPEAHLR